MFGSRRHRFWFGVLGLLALSLPYGSLAFAAIRSVVNPPAAVVQVPEVAVPTPRFPVLQIPKLSAPGVVHAPASASSPSSSPTRNVAASAGTQRRPVAQHVVRRPVAGATAGRPVPIVRSTHSLVPPVAKSNAHTYPSSGTISGLAQALAAAPVVANTAPPPPPLTTPPPVTMTLPTDSAPTTPAAAAPTVTVTSGTDQSYAAHTVRQAHAVAHAAISSLTAADSSSAGTTAAADNSAAATATSAAAPARTAVTAAPADTSAAPAPAAATTAAPADTSAAPAPAAAAPAAAADSSAPAAAAPPATTASPDPAAAQIAGPSTDGTQSAAPATVAPQPASLGAGDTASSSDPSAADSSQSSAPAPSGSGDSANASGTSSTDSATPSSSPAAVAPQQAGTQPNNVDSTTSTESLALAPTGAEINSSATTELESAAGGAGAPQTIGGDALGSASPVTAAPDVTVVAVSSAVSGDLAVPTVSAVADGSPASGGSGSTSVDAADAQPGTLTLTDASQNDGQQLVDGSDSLSIGLATSQTASSGMTSSKGAPTDDSSSSGITPQTTSLATTAPDSDVTSISGTLGARGPPAAYGPVLILAATGGSVRAGNATLMFAPSSLPHDAYVSVTVSQAAVAGVSARSASYDLTAIDTVTGATIEQFASAPQLSIDVGVSGDAVSPQIYYLPPGGTPVAIASSFDVATGTVSAGLPHFSTYVAGSPLSDFLATVESTLASFVGKTGPISESVSPGDLRIGGVVEIDSPMLSFSITSITGSGAAAQFTGSVTISAASGGIAAGDFNASFGSVSGWYTLNGQTAGAGTVGVTIANPQITIANFVTLSATSIQVTAQDDGTTTQTELGATGVMATLTTGTGPTLTVTNATLGVVARSADAGGTAPTFALLSTGNVSLSGAGLVVLTGTNWQVEYDALGDLSATPITVSTGSGTPPVIINFAQPSGVNGKWTSIQGSAALTVAGASLSGQCVISASGSQLSITASNVGLSLGSYATVTGGHGTVVITGAGTVADLGVSTVTLNLPDLSPANLTNPSVQVNTESTAVVDPTSGTPLPAGPYVQVAVTIPQTAVIVAGTTLGQIQGNLLVQQQTAGGATTTLVALTDASIWVASAATPSVFNGQGVLVVSPAGLAGYVSGTAQVSGGGASGSGDVLLQINTTGAAVNATVTVAGQPVTINYTAAQGNLFAVSISNLALNIDNVVTVEGTISYSTQTVNGIPGQEFAGTGLTLFFGNGPAQLSNGDPNPLAVGVEITNATVALFTDGNGNYALSATGTVALVGTGSVSASGTGTIQVNTFTSAFTNITIALPGSGGQSVPINVPAAPSATAPFVSVGALGLNLNILGQTLSGDVTVTDPNNTIDVNVSHGQVSLSDGNGSVSSRGPPIVGLTNGTGEIDISSAGVTGGLAGTVTVAPPGATLTGTFQLLVNTTALASSVTLGGQSTPLPAGPYFEFSAPGSGSTPGATLTIGSQSLSGDFTLQQSTIAGVTTTIVTVSNASLSILSGSSTLLAVKNGQGSLIVSTAGVVGSLTATVDTAPSPTGPLGGLSVNALTIAVNTTSTAAQGVPAGPFFGIEAAGATLTVAGQTVTGDFGVEVSTASGATVVIATVANATASLGGGIMVLSGGSGALLVSGSGVAASFTGTLAVNVPGVSVSGTLSIQVNSTSADVNTTFALGATSFTLTLPGAPAGSTTEAPYVQVSGTGLTLSVAGQTLTGDFTFTSGSGAVTITLANVSLGLGNETTNFVNVSNGAGSLTLAGSSSSTANHGGIYGEFGASVATDVPGVAFSSTLQVEFNTTGASQTVGGNPLAAGSVEITGTGVSLTVAGVQMGADSFTITVTPATGGGAGAASETAVEIAVTNLTLSFGTFVNVTKANQLSGAIIVDGNGVAAALSATAIGSIFTGLPSGVTIGQALAPAQTMSVALEINTGAQPVNETIGGQTINVPAGPYLQVLVLGAALTIGSNAVSGSFAFEQQGSGATAETVLAATGVSATVGGASLTNGQGVLVLTSTGVAGYVSGTGAGTSGGVSISGTVLLQINTTGGAVNASVMLGGQQVTIDYSASQGNLFSLSVSNLSLNIDNVVTVEGTISYSTFTDPTNNIPGKEFAGTGLTLFFGNGPAQLSNGDPNPLAVGVEITGATVVLFTDGNGNYVLSATGTVALVGTGSVTASGQGTILVNTFQKQFNDTIALPGSGGQSLPLVFGAMQMATATAPFFSVGALGLNLNILGQTLSGDVTVTDPNGTIQVTVSNAQVSLSDGNGNVNSRGPPFAQLTNGSGEIDISSAGVATAVTGSVAFTLPGVSLSGTFSLQVNTSAQSVTLGGSAAVLPAGPYFQLAAIGSGSTPGATLTVAGQSLSGDFTITQLTVAGATTTTVTIANGALSIAAGGTTYLSLTGGQGSLTISPAGIVGSLIATVKTLAIPGVTLNAVAIALNTTSTAAHGIPAGPFFGVEADGASVSVAGQTLRGNLAIQVSTASGGATVAVIAVSGASASFGGGLATLTGGSGALLVSSLGVAGTFTGTIALNVPGVSVSGTLSVRVNTTSQTVPSTQFTVAGQSIVVSLPKGPFIQVSGTGVQISVLGQALSGNFTLTSSSTATTLVVSGATLSLGGGAVSVTGVGGNVTLDAGGAKATISGSLSVAVPGVSVSVASVTVSFDTHTPSSFSMLAAGASVTIAGQTLVGNLSIAQGADASGNPAVLIAFENQPGDGLGNLLTLGPTAGPAIVTVANGSGELLITSQGVAGDLHLTGVTVSLPGGLQLGTGAFELQMSTLPTAVTEQFTIPASSGPETLSLPAGPYVSVSITAVSLTISQSVSLTGNFLFQEQGSGSSAVTVIAVSNVGASAGGLTLSGGQGALVITSGGIAGIFSGKVSGSSGGVQVSAQGILQVDSNGAAVDQTVTVGGQSIEIKFGQSTAPVFTISLSNASINIGDFVSITGNVSFGSDPADGAGAESFAGNGLQVFLGQGPATLPDGSINPLATGVLLANAQIGLVEIPGTSGTTYALVASGTATLVGVSGITVTGTVTVQFNNTGQAFSETLTIPGSTNPGVALDLAADAPASFAITGGQLGLLGQTLSGNFAFSDTNGTVVVAASEVSLSLGGGAVSITNGTGALQITSSGVAASISGTLALTLPGVSFGGGFAIEINTGTAAVAATLSVGGQSVAVDLPAGPFVQVAATNTTLTIAGQTLTGSFSVQSATLAGGGSALTIVASGVSLSLAGGAVTLSGGQGALLVTSTGVAGQLSGNVAVSLGSSVAVSGAFSLAINTGTSAVNQTFTLGSSTVALDVPGGPYLEVQATGATITVLGRTLSGNLAIVQDASGAKLQVGISNGALSLGGSNPLLSITQITGALFLEPGGLVGSLSGAVALTVPGVSISGNLSLQINTGAAAVNDSITVGGVAVGVNVPAGPFVQVAGTGVQLSVLGQTVGGDVTITSQPGSLQIALANLTATFGGTPTSPILTATQVGTGGFVISSGGIVGSIAVNLALANLPGIALSGQFSLAINTTSAAAQGLPAGPYVEIQATGATLTILGQTLSANIAVQQATNASGATVVSVGVSNGSLSLAGGVVSATNISGLLELASGGVAGTLTATIALGSDLSSSVSLGGTFTVSVNTGSKAVSDSLAVGGTTVVLNVPAGPFLSILATGATLTVLGQTLSGNFSLVQSATGTGPSGVPGAPDTPVAVKLSITNGSLGLGDGQVKFVTLTNINGDLLLMDGPQGTSTTATKGIAAQLSATVAIQGIPGVSLAGTLTLQINTTGTAIDAVFQDPGAPTSTNLTLPASPAGSTVAGTYLQVSGTGVSLTIAGQTLTGNFSFTSGGGVVTINLSNVTLGLGDGTTNFVNVSNGSGTLSIVSSTTVNGAPAAGGVYGQFGGSVAIDVPGVSFAGTLQVQFNTTGATQGSLSAGTTQISGSGVHLAVAGVQMGADSFTITVTQGTPVGGSTSETAVEIYVKNLTLSLGTFVNVTTANALTGAIIINHNGVAATFSATNIGSIFTIPGVTIGQAPTPAPTMSMSFEINTGTQPVNETITDQTNGSQTIDVPAGPYLKVILNNAALQFGGSGGPSITGSFAFDQSTEAGFGSAVATAGGAGSGPTIPNVSAADVTDGGRRRRQRRRLPRHRARHHEHLRPALAQRGQGRERQLAGLHAGAVGPGWPARINEQCHRRVADGCQQRWAGRPDRQHRRRRWHDEHLSERGQALHHAHRGAAGGGDHRAGHLDRGLPLRRRDAGDRGPDAHLHLAHRHELHARIRQCSQRHRSDRHGGGAVGVAGLREHPGLRAAQHAIRERAGDRERERQRLQRPRRRRQRHGRQLQPRAGRAVRQQGQLLHRLERLCGRYALRLGGRRHDRAHARRRQRR